MRLDELGYKQDNIELYIHGSYIYPGITPNDLDIRAYIRGSDDNFRAIVHGDYEEDTNIKLIFPDNAPVTTTKLALNVCGTEEPTPWNRLMYEEMSKRGIKLVESKTTTSGDFTSLVTLKVKSLEGENIISGTIFGKTMPRLLRINDFYLEAMPEGHNLLIHNLDVPGMIGRIATTMGDKGINIGRMAVSQQKEEKQNVILLTTNVTISDEILNELSGLENIFSVKRIEL